MPVHGRGEEVRVKLMRKLLNDGSALPETLANALAGGQTPTVVFVEVNSSAWTEEESSALLSWLQSWTEFPDLPAGRGIFLFVGIRHETPRGILKGRRIKKAQARVTDLLAHVGSLERSSADLKPGFTSGRRYSVAVLDQLGPIPLEDAHSWVDRHAAKYCPEYVAMYDKINQFYEGRVLVPMEDLVGVLRKLLNECSPSSAHA